MDQALNPTTLWTASGAAGALLFLLYYLIKEIKWARNKAETSEQESKQKDKFIADNQLQMLDVFNRLVHAVSQFTEAQKKNTEVIERLEKEIRNARDN